MLVERTGWGLSLPAQNIGPLDAVKDPPDWTGKLQSDEVRAKATAILKTPSFQEGAQKMQKGALQYGGSHGAAKQVEEWANLSKQGRLPKSIKVKPFSYWGSCCAALCS